MLTLPYFLFIHDFFRVAWMNFMLHTSRLDVEGFLTKGELEKKTTIRFCLPYFYALFSGCLGGIFPCNGETSKRQVQK